MVGCPHREPGVVGRPFRSAASGQKALPDGWKWSAVVGKPSRRVGSGREALNNGLEALPEG